MKKFNILYLGWLLFFVTIWFKSCGSSEKPNTHKITIPEIKGKFEPKTDIIHKPITKENVSLIDEGKDSKTLINKEEQKLKNDIAELYKENEELKKNYIDADSLQRELMYLKSIKLSEFYSEFDNDTINILIKGIVQGEVKQLQPFYTIKERKQSITIPEVKFRFLAGATIGNTLEFDRPLFSAGIGFQNKKGNILLSSFDTEKRISIGYYQSIFKIKK